jgi:hypothetical protein
MSITIPPEALEAGTRTLCNEQRLFWHGLRSEAQDIIRGEARAVFIAMIEAWPGMRISWLAPDDGAIVLPLTEASDDQ